MSKGSARRPLGRDVTIAEAAERWDETFRNADSELAQRCAEKALQSAEEIHAEQIAIQVTDGRENGLTDEKIEALLEERFGVYISLEDYDNADT